VQRYYRYSAGLKNAIASANLLLFIGLSAVACLAAAGCGYTRAGTSASSPGTTATSQISPSSSGLSFGNVTVGSSSSELVTLTVTGSENVTISKVTTAGSGFTASGGSNAVVAPNESVTISVGFEPTVAGSASGTLLISSNASNASLQIPLSGDGLDSTNHSVTLTWLPSTSSVIGYLVFRGASSSSLDQLNSSPVSSTSYTDTSVVDGQTYVYAVKSAGSGAELSGLSSSVTVTIPSQ
jgi:hypothetical protein